jgi:predicted nucleic acid-binding protein
MLLYLDTNIILARYAPDEPQHYQAKTILQKIDAGEFAAVTSVLTLVEVVCTTSRAYEKFNVKSKTFGREEVAGAFLKRILNMKKLTFVPMGGEVSVNAAKGQVEIPALFALAFEIGSKTGVKTLDTLHLASASIALKFYGNKIDYFVTLDEDILKRSKEITGLIKCKVVSPVECLLNLS